MNCSRAGLLVAGTMLFLQAAIAAENTTTSTNLFEDNSSDRYITLHTYENFFLAVLYNDDDPDNSNKEWDETLRRLQESRNANSAGVTRIDGNVEIKVVIDPAGHGPFVIAPADIIAIEDFVNAISAPSGQAVEDEKLRFSFSRPDAQSSSDFWADMELIFQDSGLPVVEGEKILENNLFGESVTTVAGFPGVTTNFEGRLFPDRIVGDFIVGSKGGLPTGQPITYSVEITPEGAGLWPFLIDISSSQLPLPNLFVNDENAQTVTVRKGEPVDIKLAISANSNTAPADWWLLGTVDHENFFFYDLVSDTWSRGLEPTYQGSLRDLPPTVLTRFPQGIPVSGIDIIFAVDEEMNGIPDESSLRTSLVRYEWEDSLP